MQLAFKIPDPLHEDLKKCAQLEQRSINNWMRVHLPELVAAQLKAHKDKGE